MTSLIPNQIPENNWKKLEPNRAYAFRSQSGQDVKLRVGAGGLYLAINESASKERVINTIGLEDGTYSVIGKIPQGKELILGRSTDASIHVPHAIVSRKHLEFFLDGNVLVVKDLGTTNGTYCYTENFHFDIQKYLEKSLTLNPSESTMDAVHEAFGPTIDDFLIKFKLKLNK